MVEIRSTRNSRVVETAKLHRSRHRVTTGLTIVEGRVVFEALQAGVTPKRLFASSREQLREVGEVDGESFLVTPEVLQRVAGTTHPRGPVAVVEVPTPAGSRGGNVLVLWGLADPGNVGSLLRTAAAFRFDVAAVGGVDLWSPKVLRAAAGAHFNTRLLGDTVPEGVVRVASVSEGGVLPWELPKGVPVALLVGEEAAGLPPEIVAECSMRTTVPSAMESLNAAVAGGVIMYELVRSSVVRKGHGGAGLTSDA